MKKEPLVLQLEVYLNTLSRQISLATSLPAFYHSVSLENMVGTFLSTQVAKHFFRMNTLCQEFLLMLQSHVL